MEEHLALPVAHRIEAIMRKHRLDKHAAAATLGVSFRTLEGWLSGRPCGRQALVLIDALEQGRYQIDPEILTNSEWQAPTDPAPPAPLAEDWLA